MSVPSQWMECSWTENNDSDRSADEEFNNISNLGIFPPPQVRPRAKKEPIILVNTEELEYDRIFWQNCLIGVFMDIKRFTIRTVQHIINKAWRLRDRVTVVGRNDNNYVIHFNDANGLHFIRQHGLWSLERALLALDIWRSNTNLNTVNLWNIPIWVQLWGLTLHKY